MLSVVVGSFEESSIPLLCEERLCSKSRDKVGLPWCFVSKHRVQDRKQLSHAGSDGHFFGFACSDESTMEIADGLVVTNGSQRGHVENGADVQTSASNMARALVPASI